MLSDDPVVVYDMMREAANRLCAFYARQVTAGGLGDPAIGEIRAVWAEVNAVDTRDLEAQRAATAEFRRRYKTRVEHRDPNELREARCD